MYSIDKKINLVSLALPIFFENFLRLMLGNVNIYMVGKYSDKAVAAVGVSDQVISFMLMVYGTLAFGAAVYISQNLGAGKRTTAAQTANVAFSASIVFGLVLSILVSVFAGGILKIMNLPAELMEYGIAYLTIVGGASFCQSAISAMSAIARNYGYTKISMYIILGMNVVNVLGNCIVIYRPFGIPDFGIYGIASSNALSQVLAVLIMFRMLFRYMDTGLRFRLPVPYPFFMLWKMVRLGVPGGGDFLFYNAGMLMSTYIVTMLGTNALTAMVYMLNILKFVFVAGLSIGQATQIMIGHMLGAGEDRRAFRACRKSTWITMLIDMTAAVTFFLLGRHLLEFYTNNKEVIRLGFAIFIVDLAWEPGRVFNLVTANALRITGDVEWPLLISASSIWLISVPLSYILGIHFKLGLTGVFIAFTADEWVRGQVLHLRWRSGVWKRKRVVKPQNNNANLEYSLSESGS